MIEPVMKYGACKGTMSGIRRWIAKAIARDIRIFPVPGADILRRYQDEDETDFIIAPNSREANVLLVVGDLTDALAQKAAVAYQQIPRPRVLVLAGPEQLPHLPKPDLHVALANNFLEDALPKVQELFKHHAWSEKAEPWEPEFLSNLVEESGDDGGQHHHHHDHGSGAHNHNEHTHEDNDADHESHDHNNGHNHESGGNQDHENGGHDHGGMDFMSMVAMTKDLPRPKDGLPMNRSKLYFGPFHPGLPGGLSVFIELDGDTVIEARVESERTAQSLEDFLPVDAGALPDLLARLNPLSPQSYRLLAHKVLANVLRGEDSISSNELIMLESERVGSHLNWLATFGKTVGNRWMHRQAARWHALHRSEEGSAEKLQTFLDQIRSMAYLQTKLSIGGIIPGNLLHHFSGPVAKAAGREEDARSGERIYEQLGWEPVIKRENNAWGRLGVRLDEIEQSLELIEKSEGQRSEMDRIDLSNSGEGSAILESPRGTLELRVGVENGKVEQSDLATPSQPLAGLVPTLAEEAELSDALVQVASLDISPWEVQLKRAEENQ